MKWFDNLKLRTKLLVLAGLIIAAMVALSAYNLTITAKITQAGQDLYEHNMTGEQAALLARGAFVNVAAGIYHHLVGEEGAKTYDDMEKLIHDQTAVLQQALKDGEKAAQDEKQLGLLKDVEAELSTYLKDLPELLEHSRAGDKAAAIKVATRIKPRRLAAAAKLDELVKLEIDSAEQRNLENTTAASAAQRNSLIALVVVGLLAFLFSLWVANLIVSPIKSVQQVAERLAEGDLSHKVAHRSKDEVGTMSGHLDRAIENLRQLVSQVANTSEQVAASSEELASSAQQVGEVTQQVAMTIQQVAKGSDEQAKAAQQTSEVVENMSASIEQVAGSTQRMARDANSAVETAGEGRQAVEKAITQMEAIRESAQAVGQAVRRLGEQSHEIGRIVEVITGIADQTNLLALNAAIEAARAGEQGRGFAVVAEEVRKLAEQSRTAAEQISTLVRDIQSDTSKAVTMMETGSRDVESGTGVVSRTGEAFSAIAKAVETVVGQIQEVSAATQQLSAGSQQVVKSVENIAAITEQAAAGAEEVSASSEEQSASVEEIAASAESLAEMAQGLQKAVSRFRL